jgi:hypothetical protein
LPRDLLIVKKIARQARSYSFAGYTAIGAVMGAWCW